MFLRLIGLAAFVAAASALQAEEIPAGTIEQPVVAAAPEKPNSAWLDLRQIRAATDKPQTAPAWVRSLTQKTIAAKDGAAAKTIFRIELTPPPGDYGLLMMRLFFEDTAEQRPRILASDESGERVLETPPLGMGMNIETSETVMVPTDGVSTVDIEVPGNGKSVRAAYLDWMASSEVLRPVNSGQRYLMPEAFDAGTPLNAPKHDSESFGTVTAALAPETIQMGPSVQTGAAFQFALEAQPLLALITFEVASANIDAPPEIYLNGENLGPVSLTLPELADPAYRGEMKALVRQMRFQYTGWLRAQKLVPASSLRVGENGLLIIAGPGTPVSAIRATQIQLKYLWEKLDYELVPAR